MPDVVNGYNWELYNLTEDYSQFNDLAAKMPGQAAEMQELFLVEAAKYNVFPLDNSILERALTPRPSATAGRDRVHLFRRAVRPADQRSARASSTGPTRSPPRSRSPRAAATACSSPRAAASAATASICSRASRCSPTTCWRWSASAGKATRRSTPGKHTIVFDFTSDGPGFGKGGTGVLKVDGSGGRQPDDPAHDPVPHDDRRDLRRRRRYPHRRSTTRTTRCRSASPARSTSYRFN